MIKKIHSKEIGCEYDVALTLETREEICLDGPDKGKTGYCALVNKIELRDLYITEEDALDAALTAAYSLVQTGEIPSDKLKDYKWHFKKEDGLYRLYIGTNATSSMAVPSPYSPGKWCAFVHGKLTLDGITCARAKKFVRTCH